MKVRTRWFPLWMLSGIVLETILLEFLILDRFNDSALTSSISILFIYALIAGWMFKTAKRKRIIVSRLVKPGRPKPRNLGILGLVIVLIIFSFGAILVTYWILAHVWPGLLSFWNVPDHVSANPRIRVVHSIVDKSSSVILAPVLEELLFRGILLNRWAEKWGVRKAIFFSSAAFGILHPDPIGAFTFGICMCLLYLKTETLRYSMLAHAINNSIIELLTLIPHQGAATPPESYRPFPWFGLVAASLSLPFLLRFIVRNWPARNSLSPYKREWVRTVLADVPA